MKKSGYGSILGLSVIAASLLITMGSTQAATQFKPKQAGDFLIRARIVDVLPDESLNSNIGGSGHVNNDVIPELDFSYFFTDHFALELIAGTSKHDVDWHVGGSKVDLGSVRLLPPTLTAQYHFMPDSRFSPYVGAGINYTLFYNEHHGNDNSSIDYGNKFGYAFQAGLDYAIAGNWSFNIDVKKLYLKAKVDTSVGGTAVHATGHLNPWLVGVGVGYRF
ncbi:OmpW/AlkL family protein [Celerinatantimonas sp. YJH-8]|uniref:OmpW/AlkL family protein n=1 Tax=Celerinatantimonas sp. YJH-8 TaxID=3228714 RepID=UPI0038C9D360